MWLRLAFLFFLAAAQSLEETQKKICYKDIEFPVHRSNCSFFNSSRMTILYHAVLPCKNYHFKPLVGRTPWTKALQEANPVLKNRIQDFSSTAWEQVFNRGYVRTVKYGLSWQEPTSMVFEQQEMNNSTRSFVFRSAAIHVDFSSADSLPLDQELAICGSEEDEGFVLTVYGLFFPSGNMTKSELKHLKTMRDEQLQLLEDFGQAMEAYCPMKEKKVVEMIFSRTAKFTTATHLYTR